MSAKFPERRNAPATRVAPTTTALPPSDAHQAPAKTLSGAFATALGAKPQMPHAGSPLPQEKGSGSKAFAVKASAPPIRSGKPGMPTVLPRKGHR